MIIEPIGCWLMEFVPLIKPQNIEKYEHAPNTRFARYASDAKKGRSNGLARLYQKQV